MKKIADQVYYVGVNDLNKRLFEGLWPIPEGVTYNSYLVVDEKVCLMDTVEIDFYPQFLAKERLKESFLKEPIINKTFFFTAVLVMNDNCLAKLLKFHYISKQSFDFYGINFPYTYF